MPDPGPGEIVVRVAAPALNSRDIPTATGLVPPPALDRRPGTAVVGLECAGTVTAVGPGVRDLAPGDRVACLTIGCLGTHTLVRADQALPLPPAMTFAEAATLPVAFLTVHHSLRHLARLAAGETLLVHGAAGGVGLAAVQYARHVGARVIATAGSPAKRDLLHLLGVDHVLGSRGLRFAEPVADLTGGRGVDVVLNSLAGEALRRSLGLVAPHGRFVELGKRDFLGDAPLPSAPFDRNLAFFGVDVSALLDHTPDLADAHLKSIAEAIRHGTYRPLPHRAYPAHRVEEAFACLQHSRHVGKVVVTFGPAEEVTVRRDPVPARPDPGAAYLITGGLGGFGAATARHLADLGARHLVLVGRRGPAAPEAPALLADLRALGVHVSAYAADAADRAALETILADLDATGRRLAGVVHGAMVLDDAPLAELTPARVRAVMEPKLTAGRLLDELTRGRDLDFFVVHSSSAALVGNLHQASYSAANVALEALVRDRRAHGLPALAVQWGALADAGYVHRSGRGEELVGHGLGGLAVRDALAELDRLLGHPGAVVAAVGHFDWERAQRLLPRLLAPRTAGLVPEREDTEAAARLREALAGATAEEALRLVTDALTDVLAQVLQTTPDRVDPRRRLDAMGLDSLMAAEFAAHLSRRFGCDIPLMAVSFTPLALPAKGIMELS
ncbi:SDR family NAD(P)-dependent oxidoreductase [Streptomyces specialis]|uniref:SDR family NAD(P)-dependent oxidoreductase n=1 Tax=Streptomyces specialis TaxID=498367 RepID=UPI00073E9CF3|nr:SDR family NAD(P)-dependent oxidoreductase [Streptomyces specialis]